MKRRKTPKVSDSELLSSLFGTDDLKGTFGTDDATEILAQIDEETIVGAEPDGSVKGFEDEDKEFKETVLMAKKIKARLDKSRSSGSLNFLAEKLGKTSRQIREYCKAGRVPGAYQTNGGHWRVKYEDDTVERTYVSIAEKSRRRSDGWLIKRLRKSWKEIPAGWEELILNPKLLENRDPNKIIYAEAAQSLALQSKNLTGQAIARLTGRSRTTVRKYMPHLKHGKMTALYNNPLVDRHNDQINQKKNGIVSTKNNDFSEGDNAS